MTLTTTASYNYKLLVDQAADTNIDNKGINVGAMGISGTLADEWMGGGLNTFGLV